MTRIAHEEFPDAPGGGVAEVVSVSATEALTRAEVDVSISTAKRFPRTVSTAKKEMVRLACIDTGTANACVYSLPRRDENGQTKQIIGPSARFAEIVASAWGNLRVGARVIDDAGHFVVCQAVAHDLQTNTSVSVEIRRRITTKTGKRYGDDMIGVTANAGISIALRNSVLKCVPKAYWVEAFDSARKVIAGNADSFSSKRSGWIQFWNKAGVSTERILAAVGKKGVEDMDGDSLTILAGLHTRTTEEENVDLDELFPPITKPAAPKPDAPTAPAEGPQSRTQEMADALPPTQNESRRPKPRQDAPQQPPEAPQ